MLWSWIYFDKMQYYWTIKSDSHNFNRGTHETARNLIWLQGGVLKFTNFEANQHPLQLSSHALHPWVYQNEKKRQWPKCLQRFHLWGQHLQAGLQGSVLDWRQVSGSWRWRGHNILCIARIRLYFIDKKNFCLSLLSSILSKI